MSKTENYDFPKSSVGLSALRQSFEKAMDLIDAKLKQVFDALGAAGIDSDQAVSADEVEYESGDSAITTVNDALEDLRARVEALEGSS